MYCKEMIKKDYRKIYNRFSTFEIVTCPMCNDDFERPKSKPNIVTFSEYCMKRRISATKRKGVYVQCDICDKAIWIGPKSFYKKHHYCSNKCSNLGWSYFSDDYDLIKLARRPKFYGKNWNMMRNKARERDNFTCQMCGIKEGNNKNNYHQQLSVHHIKPFVLFETYQQANVLSNLICYCEPCHRKAHSGKNHHSQYINQAINKF